MTVPAPQLKDMLSFSLPGWEAQRLMSPVHDAKYRELSNDYRSAAVMALLYPTSNGDRIILIERARHNTNDKHAGQISFPGGKYEEEDGDMISCALRETEEEIGIRRDAVEVLGPLSSLFVFASNFLVYPFLGRLSREPEYILQTSEVHQVLTVSVADILDSSMKMVSDISTNRGTIENVPCYNVDGKKLWGATAMIMSEVEYLLQQVVR